MSSINTENLDSILQTADYINNRLFEARHMPDEILLGDFFDEIREVVSELRINLFDDQQKLNAELRSQFMSYPESRLQDRFANYLIYQIKDKLRPLYNQVSSEREDFEVQPYGKGQIFEGAGFSLFWNAERVSYTWINVLLRNIKMFAPERYEENKSVLDLPVYDEDGPYPTDRVYGSTPLQPSEPDEKDENMNVKILIAHQSGLLTGTFQNLPLERQYAVLSVLFGRSKANIKNALTSLYGDANSDKNPRNLGKVVEKANDLITSKDLGIPLIKNRTEQ